MQTLRQRFDDDGFLVLEGFAPVAACETLMRRGRELADGFDLTGPASIFQTSEQTRTSDDYFLASGDAISFFFEKDAFDAQGRLQTDLFHALNKIGHALHDRDPVFAAFSRSPQLRQLAGALELEEHLLIQSMLIFKHARIGGVVDVHQDATFLYTEPLSCVGFWFALEDATIENGCLWAAPGGHRTPLRKRFRRAAEGGTAFDVLDASPFDTAAMVPLEVPAGTCIVLDGRLPHASQPNTSGRSRQAYSVHVIDPRAHYPADNWLQRDMSAVRGF